MTTKSKKMNTNNSPERKSTWVMLVYFILCYYCFGVAMMMHFFDYPSFDRIQENIKPAIEMFNHRMAIISYIPKIGLLISSIAFLRYAPNYFPKWMIWTSLFFCTISVATLFFVIIPIHSDVITTGFTATVKRNLLNISMTFQVLPSLFQALIAVLMLNILLKDEKLFGRWLFILTLILIFYLFGTDNVEKFVNYPMWATIGQKNWLPFRTSVAPSTFFAVYVIPSFLPIIFLGLMIWWRPIRIPKIFVFISLLAELWAFVITGIYFIPKIQAPLGANYSLPLIEELIKNDLPLRGIPLLVIVVLTALMFTKIGQQKLNKQYCK